MPAEEDMMKSSNFKFILLSFLVLSVFISCSKTSPKNDARSKEIVVYAYDSFLGEWGPGSEIEKRFEAKYDYDLVFVACDDGVQVLSRAILEKDDVQADVILGIDNNLSQKATKSNILMSYKPKNAESVIPEYVVKEFPENWILTPYDYSHFAMIYDTESDVPCPKSLEDLTNSVYEKKIILMDPRTSTPGLGFLAWTVAVYGDKVSDYWKSLKPNILTMAPSWSTGYGLFKQGEAPLVISYTTSPASHVEYDNTDRYVAAIFEEGHSIQVEGAGILLNAPNKKGAELFMDFLISEDAQSVIPLTQWMNPANKNVELPESYKKAAPIPEKTLSVNAEEVSNAVDKIITILAL